MVVSDFLMTVYELFTEFFAIGGDLLLTLTGPNISIVGRIAAIISTLIEALPIALST